MLARYQIKRGLGLAGFPARVRRGRRIDTRKHTRHCLRPAAEEVATFLRTLDAGGDADAAWRHFEAAYLALIEERFERDPKPFDELAAAAEDGDVFLGCSCPTAKNPDVNRCHTVLALRFLEERYADLSVEFP